MSESLKRLKLLWSTNNRFTLLEKVLMSYHLIKCFYYDFRAYKARDIYKQRMYDSCYLHSWLKYKLIFYKPLP